MKINEKEAGVGPFKKRFGKICVSVSKLNQNLPQVRKIGLRWSRLGNVAAGKKKFTVKRSKVKPNVSQQHAILASLKS